MAIISKETWENLIPEDEKKAIKEYYSDIDEGAIFEEGKISAFQHIFGEDALKPQLTYEDMARELFKDGAWQFRTTYYIEGDSNSDFRKDATPTFSLNLTSERQAEKLLAINRLLNVAKFLNGNWKPEHGKEAWCIGIDRYNGEINPIDTGNYDYATEIVYFRTEELTQQAVAILGEETVRLALTTEY